MAAYSASLPILAHADNSIQAHKAFKSTSTFSCSHAKSGSRLQHLSYPCHAKLAGAQGQRSTAQPCLAQRKSLEQQQMQRQEQVWISSWSSLLQSKTLWVSLGVAALSLLSCDHVYAQTLGDASNSPHYHPVAADIQNLAQNEEFWSNLARYGRYFITVLLGTAYTSLKPVGNLLRRPVTAGLVVVVLVGLYFFVSTTLAGMLGTNQAPLSLYDF